MKGHIMSKFSDVAAEAAYTISLHGFAEEAGDVETVAGWNGLADVSPVTLRNVGENELADRFAEWLTAQGVNAAAAGSALIWVRADNDGFVNTVQWGHDGGTRSGVDAVSRAWDAFVEALDSDDEESEPCTKCGADTTDNVGAGYGPIRCVECAEAAGDFA